MVDRRMVRSGGNSGIEFGSSNLGHGPRQLGSDVPQFQGAIVSTAEDDAGPIVGKGAVPGRCRGGEAARPHLRRTSEQGVPVPSLLFGQGCVVGVERVNGQRAVRVRRHNLPRQSVIVNRCTSFLPIQRQGQPGDMTIFGPDQRRCHVFELPIIVAFIIPAVFRQSMYMNAAGGTCAGKIAGLRCRWTPLGVEDAALHREHLCRFTELGRHGSR
mmetsp:Transcript_14426/g.41462  ORF Transcript_14426/g.41462 Transcript_14426/m.41462 type:complete len:214 (+) Transcript_14426:524-1165(+)